MWNRLVWQQKQKFEIPMGIDEICLQFEFEIGIFLVFDSIIPIVLFAILSSFIDFRIQSI